MTPLSRNWSQSFHFPEIYNRLDPTEGLLPMALRQNLLVNLHVDEKWQSFILLMDLVV